MVFGREEIDWTGGFEEMTFNYMKMVKKERAFLDGINKKLNLGKYVGHGKHLDFGCGWGFFMRALKEKFSDLDVVGIDANKKKISFAKKMYKLPLKFICSNKITGMYDSVSVKFVFHEVSGGLENSIKDIRKHLKDEGIIFVYDYKKVSKEKFRALYDKEGDWPKSFGIEYKEHCKLVPEEFKKVMEDSGFETIRIKSDKIYWFMYLGRKKK